MEIKISTVELWTRERQFNCKLIEQFFTPNYLKFKSLKFFKYFNVQKIFKKL